MPPIHLELEEIYDGHGQHFGGVYSPLLQNGRATESLIGCLSTRPAHHLIWMNDAVCPNPHSSLARVWMMLTVEGNPLVTSPVSPAVLPYLVQALDGGASVQLHAPTMEAIKAVCETVAPLLGGGHS